MKEFNLKEALEGAPVVTRRGLKVSRLHLFEIDHLYPLYALIEGEVIQCTTKGQFRAFHESDWDLFMAEQPKFLWINLWQQLHENGNYISTVHTREDLADLEIENNLILKHIQKIIITL